VSVATLFRGFVAGVPPALRLAATLRSAAGATTAATVLEGVLGPERRAYEPGTALKAGEREAGLVADGLAFAPAIGMTLDLGGTVWSILDVGVVEPTDQGAPILYRLVLAR
jgi:hypothetical protein